MILWVEGSFLRTVRVFRTRRDGFKYLSRAWDEGMDDFTYVFWSDIVRFILLLLALYFMLWCVAILSIV